MDPTDIVEVPQQLHSDTKPERTMPGYQSSINRLYENNMTCSQVRIVVVMMLQSSCIFKGQVKSLLNVSEVNGLYKLKKRDSSIILGLVSSIDCPK